ncbi:hypothetical protein Mgra_00002250 [Meloidogyne graminicola]|uniref:Uncharacterized protein n=1 Tax=Meloidogyne graminicola TaxID=189291 RepID=A0A8S9ZZ42_9BILA|nr:hypothetical protein Mgra_00002250 [Meloidogyne graminicola]
MVVGYVMDVVVFLKEGFLINLFYI